MSVEDTRELRNALGAFATGVTIVTTIDETGGPDATGGPLPVAITANSFSSVSLDPPLILWSIGRNAQCFEAFERARSFAVHILHSGQQELSNLCATKNADKFAAIDWHPGLDGVPVFDDYHTCFQCSVEQRYDGGDHVIILGRVHEYDNRQKTTHAAPLVFYQGQYKNIA